LNSDKKPSKLEYSAGSRSSKDRNNSFGRNESRSSPPHGYHDRTNQNSTDKSLDNLLNTLKQSKNQMMFHQNQESNMQKIEEEMDSNNYPRESEVDLRSEAFEDGEVAASSQGGRPNDFPMYFERPAKALNQSV